MFNLSIGTTVMRFYLMMGIVMIAVFLQQLWLIPVAMLVALSAIVGYRIGGPSEKEKDQSKVVEMKGASRREKRKVS